MWRFREPLPGCADRDMLEEFLSKRLTLASEGSQASHQDPTPTPDNEQEAASAPQALDGKGANSTLHLLFQLSILTLESQCRTDLAAKHTIFQPSCLKRSDRGGRVRLPWP